MRSFLFTVLCCSVAVLAPGLCGAAAELSGQARAEGVGQQLIGMRAPSVVLKTIDGREIDLGKLYGKQAVYLKFWATWCVPCREQMPHFEHVYQTAGSDLVVIAIDSGFNDSLEDVETYRKKVGITMPIVVDDGQLGSIFHLRVTPQHIVIGRDGRIQYVGNLADERLDSALLAAQRLPSAHLKQVSASVQEDAPRYTVGDRMPDISVTTLGGLKFPLRDSSANAPTVLVFMSPWCESYLATSRPAMATSCKEVREQIDALVKEHHGVRWLGIASGLWATTDDLTSYKDKYTEKLPLTLDESGKLFRAFRIMKVPTLLVADGDGRIVKSIDGFDSGLPEELLRVSAK
jgi:thiol-disulfide isomerase/thioredoxin